MYAKPKNTHFTYKHDIWSAIAAVLRLIVCWMLKITFYNIRVY